MGFGAASGAPSGPLAAPAERLPLADASVDTVVSTLVLCTVDDPERALREIARVLRPDGGGVGGYSGHNGPHRRGMTLRDKSNDEYE